MLDLTVRLFGSFWASLDTLIGVDYIVAVAVPIVAIGFICNLTRKSDSL